MPCDHGERDGDERFMQLKLDALTALFCGYMNGKPEAIHLAAQWKTHHDRVDRARNASYGERSEAQTRYDSFMAVVHRELCGS